MAAPCQTVAVLVLTVLALVAVGPCRGLLEDKVSYYEIVEAHDLLSRVRRSVDSNQTPRPGREITVTLFNMTLTCHLSPRKNLFAPKFKLMIISGNKKRQITDFNKEQFLVGTCEGDRASDVHGHFNKDGVFEGSIKYDGVQYGLDAAERHLKEKTPGEHRGKMVAYRNADMIWDRENRRKSARGPSSYCGGAVHIDDPVDRTRFGGRQGGRQKNKHERPRRMKRATTPSGWSTCRLIAVADYKFYRFIGGNDIYSTASYIGSTMEQVDAIYRSSTFDMSEYSVTGMGFEIAEMWIMDAPSSGYNADQTSWEPLTLLQKFGRELYFKDFCVAHLFTHQQFSGNVLGLAYIAGATQGSAGGICSPTRSIEGVTTALNTGWSTTLNSNGDTVMAQQAQLVTAHELGHNWGSEHDPDTDSCSPSSIFGSGGGKYLMYAYSVDGYESNNNKFSTCSVRDIGVVLESKGSGCFSSTPDENQECGNGIVDAEEQCDAGFLGKFGLDPCCNSQCRFESTATCSPVNHECCFNCQVAPSGIQCRSDTGIGCKNASYCDGSSLACPASPNKPVGTTCLDLGKCNASGDCQSFCEARGKIACACDQVAVSCQRCCRDNATSTCQPYENPNYQLPNGRPCVIGYCSNGACQKVELTLVNRLFDLFDSISINELLQFFKDNLVGVVMVFSLLIWIPVSICITCQDRSKRRNLKHEVMVDLREDRDFLFDEDGRRIPRGAGGPGTSTPRTPRSTAPRRLPPLMSPRNQHLVGAVTHRNRIAPLAHAAPATGAGSHNMLI